MVSPVPGVAEIVTVPVPHRAAFPAVGAKGKSITVANTLTLVGAGQPAKMVLAWA